MFSSKENFKKAFVHKVENLIGKCFHESTVHEQYQCLGMMVREFISANWIATNERYRNESHKQVYYLSIEFLLGRLLGNHLLNLGVRDLTESGLKELGLNLAEIEEYEIDAGLGNGGLGRLAACFLDSLASLNLPGFGYGIRYKHGLFDQKIVDGYQVEYPEQWLKNGNIWEVRRGDLAVEVHFFGKVESYVENDRLTFRHIGAEKIAAVPYDIPIIGYETMTVNTLRLWSAEILPYYKQKDVMKYKRDTEAVSEFLYPDDSTDEGKILRLKQQYFLVSASLQTIIDSYHQQYHSLENFHHHVAIHINDTHPVLAIPELMRILIDDKGMDWEKAWNITINTISYTNHTTLQEALEKWPVAIFRKLLPRIYLIVEEINERFSRELWDKYPGEWQRIGKMAIIADQLVKMAHLAIVGSYRVNGVAKIHTEILKNREMKPFYDIFPEKFNNKTNGISHRHWLIKANPQLCRLITEAIGEGWIRDSEQLVKLNQYLDDPTMIQKLRGVKQHRKEILAARIKEQSGMIVDVSSIFDVQVKRLHAYKRQLLNILHIMHLYNRLKEDNTFTIYPRTFIFGAKASPGYYYAKKVIKLINSIADIVNNDPKTKDVLKVIFMENYRVSLAEDIFPAADVSEQISTASKEASGTGNMKFMMNGAITVGTLDGATVEIQERVGEDNIFIFGLKAEEVTHFYQNGGYHSTEYYHHDRRIKQVVNQLTNGFFKNVHDDFIPIYDSLLIENDQYFVLKDFAAYVNIQEQVEHRYQQHERWFQMCLTNIAHSGYFSSDRTIKEYANDIWKI